MEDFMVRDHISDRGRGRAEWGDGAWKKSWSHGQFESITIIWRPAWVTRNQHLSGLTWYLEAWFMSLRYGDVLKQW